jgi:hypothetical protein
MTRTNSTLLTRREREILNAAIALTNPPGDNLAGRAKRTALRRI